jgi:THO complex subunit 4
MRITSSSIPAVASTIQIKQNNNSGRRNNNVRGSGNSMRGSNNNSRGGNRRTGAGRGGKRENRPKPNEQDLDADMDSYMGSAE